MDTKPRLIFLCAGNSISSQMAEALMKKYAGDRFEVHSAGIFSKKINPLTHIVMEEVGISLDEYRSKSINEFRGKYQFKYIFTVCEHSAKLFPRSFLSQGEH
ncbi:arsenate reductase ArsC, partial [Chloroflexota bacterium]